MNYTHQELERITYINGGSHQAHQAHQAASEKDDLEDAAIDASGYIDEAKSVLPNEDFLQEAISYCKNITGRVTKHHIGVIMDLLENIQDEQWRSTEYAAEQLNLAQRKLA